MGIGYYKQWTPEQRTESLRLHNKALRLGVISRPTKCNRCGQTKGMIHTHNHNYDTSLRVLPLLINGTATEEDKQALAEAYEPLCWRCHMMLHSVHRAPEAVKKYFERISQGEQDPPVYRHNFDILKDDYCVS